MDDADFTFFGHLLRQEAGIVLTREMNYLLESRLRPVAMAQGLKNVAGMAAVLRQEDAPALRRAVVEAMMNPETSFFRDNAPFRSLADKVLPHLLAARAVQVRRHLRFWSAGCSTGQEPYSMAMVLAEQKAKLEGWEVELLATDLSQALLERAEKGVYSQLEVQRGLPVQMLVKYFSQNEGEWQVGEGIRDMVTFQQHNLLDFPYRFGLFDVIFCRNVLFEFEGETASAVLRALARDLRPDGVLFTGASEPLPETEEPFRQLEGVPGAWVRKGGGW